MTIMAEMARNLVIPLVFDAYLLGFWLGKRSERKFRDKLDAIQMVERNAPKEGKRWQMRSGMDTQI